MKKTTIQISDQVRRKLKVIASQRDISYDELLDDLTEVFNSSIPFKSEDEFASWFENNLEKLGFTKIIEKRRSTSPDYKLKTKDGEIKEVELELTDKDFERHGHDPNDVDIIVCAYSSRKKVKGVPIFPLIDSEDVVKNVVTNKSRTNLKFPRELYNEVNNFIRDTGFNSVTEFSKFLLRDVVSQGKFNSPEELTEEMKKIRERLKKLGYLDRED